MCVRMLAAISLGRLAAACQGSYSQNAPGAAAPAYGNTYQSSSAACADYGFPAGTTSFNQCVAREQQARAAGRVNRDYAAAQLTADARSACSSYGLAGGTASYDRCVSREVDARTYRDGVAQPGDPLAGVAELAGDLRLAGGVGIDGDDNGARPDLLEDGQG